MICFHTLFTCHLLLIPVYLTWMPFTVDSCLFDLNDIHCWFMFVLLEWHLWFCYAWTFDSHSMNLWFTSIGGVFVSVIQPPVWGVSDGRVRWSGSTREWFSLAVHARSYLYSQWSTGSALLTRQSRIFSHEKSGTIKFVQKKMPLLSSIRLSRSRFIII